MLLKVKEESKTGLNTGFTNVETGRSFSLSHVVAQIEKGNPNYKDYETVTKSNGTVYVRSKPDSSKKNNIE